jgi:PTS system mannose-specific IIA component
LAEDLIRTSTLFVGEAEGVRALPINPEEELETIRERIARMIQEADQGDGGTATNVCSAFIQEGKVEAITGVNLPMTMAAVRGREGKTLS